MEDVATVHRLLAAFNQGDFSALEEVDPDAEFQDEPRIPGAGWNHGHSGAVRWAVKLWQSFGRLHFEIDEPVASGGCLIARWHASGIGKRSRIPVHMGGYCVFCMRRAKVSRVEFFETEHDALDAARRLGEPVREERRQYLGRGVRTGREASDAGLVATCSTSPRQGAQRNAT